MKTLMTTSLLLCGAAVVSAQNTADSIPEPTVELDDFVVVATKPVIQSNGAKLTYNMEEDPSSKTSTLLDALKKVPMISVDGEDNIRLNGQSSFKIYINGKEDPSMTANYKNIFKAMPAEAVVKVEVITEPGAKYDAEGAAGIINIITEKRNTTDGYSGTLSGQFSRQAIGGSLFGRMRKGKFGLSANINYANGRLFNQKNDSETLTENLNSFASRYQYDRQKQIVGFDFLGGGIQVSYDLTERDLLTASTNIYTVKGDAKEGSYYSTEILDANFSSNYYVMKRMWGGIANTGVNTGATWQHQLNDHGDKTVLSYLFNYGYNHLDLKMEAELPPGMTLPYLFERNNIIGRTREHTVQFDYDNHFHGDTHLLETGAKAVWRRNSSLSALSTGDSPASATEVGNDMSDLLQKQDIYAIYASYQGRFGKVSTTAGLRFEHTDMGIDFRSGDYSDFTTRLNDLVPNAAITYSFSHASNLRLAYQMRITRPSLNSVNPYRLSLNLNQVQMGNPDLDSERSNKVTLTYSNFGTTIGGNVGLEYSAVNNAISDYSYLEDGIQYSTYANIGHDRRLFLTGYLSWTIIPRMQLGVNGRFGRVSMKSSYPDVSNSGWTATYGVDWNYSLTNGFKFNANGGQETRTYFLQGHSNGWYYYGLGISKSFLKKDALTVGVSASNFLQSRMSYKTRREYDGVYTSQNWVNYNWNVGISLSWNFGSLQGGVKQASKQIQNDDQTTVGSKSNTSL